MRLVALFCILLPLVSGGILLLSTSTSRSRAKLLAGFGLGTAAVFASILFRSGRVGIYGSFEFDPLSSFLVELLLLALAVPLLRPSSASAPPGRYLLGGALAMVAVSTRNLLWASLAIVLFPAVVRVDREGRIGLKWIFAIVPLVGLAAIAFASGGTDLALVAASGSADTNVGRAGLALVVAGLVLLWLGHSRDLFRFSEESLVSRVCASFVLLVAISGILLRLTAWLPGLAPTEVIRALALSALGVGALGMLSSTRITTYVTALALARAGIVLVALLGGVHGRMPLLLELMTTAASLFLLAWSIEAAASPETKAVSLDDIDAGTPSAARLGLLVGALSACSLPPFPGFAIRFPLARALASEGETSSLIAASFLLFLVGLGSMRVVSRAFTGQTPEAISRRLSPWEVLVGLGLAAGAMWFLGVYPAGMIELATRAVAEMF